MTVTEADLALGGGHTMPHAEESVPCTVSLTYATPINANKCNKSNNKKGGGKTRTDSVPQRPRRAERCKLVSDVGVSPASTRCSCARCCLSLVTPSREVCTGPCEGRRGTRDKALSHVSEPQALPREQEFAV